RPEISRPMLPIALAKAVLEQGGTTAFVAMQGLDADQQQVPVRLRRPIMVRSLEDCAHVGLLVLGNAVRNDRLERPVIAATPRRKPERDAPPVAGALCGSRLERAGAEGPEDARDVTEIVMRLAIHPARYRIAGKGQDERGDGVLDLSVA